MNPTLRLHRHLTGLIGCRTTLTAADAPACRVRTWADCGRVDTGPDGTITGLVCPAISCGHVPVTNHRIAHHADRTGKVCRFSRAEVIDDSTAPPVVRLHQHAPTTLAASTTPALAFTGLPAVLHPSRTSPSTLTNGENAMSHQVIRKLLIITGYTIAWTVISTMLRTALWRDARERMARLDQPIHR
ncbi:hypothetical protein [Nocardia cyriacigeorgica]|uniref:hypothetical protein n=1 Tax=Nocardia cyriacigeorgica TaxID=135487 RepID=UPI000CEB4C26|nr:hypothetical protein [Nocardia cyriacigeorgica]AVH20302.1 hypothetical protein C5B73_01280 [Nocardia cyriacigeorgica]